MGQTVGFYGVILRRDFRKPFIKPASGVYYAVFSSLAVVRRFRVGRIAYPYGVVYDEFILMTSGRDLEAGFPYASAGFLHGRGLFAPAVERACHGYCLSGRVGRI